MEEKAPSQMKKIKCEGAIDEDTIVITTIILHKE